MGYLLLILIDEGYPTIPVKSRTITYY